MRLTKRLWESQSRVLYRTIASSFADASAFFGTGNNLRDRHRIFPDIPCHAVGGGSVKIIFRKEFFRHGGGQYLSVKEKVSAKSQRIQEIIITKKRISLRKVRCFVRMRMWVYRGSICSLHEDVNCIFSKNTYRIHKVLIQYWHILVYTKYK